jgi:hypothetical protein
MQSVHPEFDPDTRTWFVPGLTAEARTLRELRELLGGPGKIKIVGWKPMGAGERPPLPPRPVIANRVLAGKADHALRLRKHFAEARRKAAEAVESVIIVPVVEQPPIAPKAERVRMRYGTPELAHTARLAGKKRCRERRKTRVLAEDEARKLLAVAAEARREAERLAVIEVSAAVAKARRAEHFGVWPPKSRRNEAWFRSRCTDVQNAALDLWAKGIKGPEIARALGTTPQFVGAHTITRARLRGDPRAVIRDPANYGKTKRQPRQRRRRNAEAVANCNGTSASDLD